MAIEAAQRTAPDQWRIQAANNKQGSDGFADAALGGRLTAEEAEIQDRVRAVYNGRLEAGVAREQARKDLPLCTYTEAYWKMDLHNLLHFLALRMDPHAQLEIREYANVIGREIVARWVPQVWEAFEDYRLGALHFSRIEGGILAAIGAGDQEQALGLARDAGWLKTAAKGGWLRHRERQEFEEKLARLNLTIPW